MRHALLALAAVALLGAVAGPAPAALIVSNLANTPFDVDSDDTILIGQQFFTDGTAYQLENVQVLLWNRPDGPATTEFALFDDDADLPGTFLVGLGTATTTTDGTDQVYTLVPLAPVVLAPNTAYWLVGLYYDLPVVLYTDDLSSTGPGAIGDYVFVDFFGPDGGDDEPYQIAVNGAAVPEPAGLALAGAGAAGLLGYARRRRAA